jgi:hypothetical protein
MAGQDGGTCREGRAKRDFVHHFPVLTGESSMENFFYRPEDIFIAY